MGAPKGRSSPMQGRRKCLKCDRWFANEGELAAHEQAAHIRSQQPAFRVGDWVAEVAGPYRRIGRIDEGPIGRNGKVQVDVQFGSGGPFEWKDTKDLRHASDTEVSEWVNYAGGSDG